MNGEGGQRGRQSSDVELGDVDDYIGHGDFDVMVAILRSDAVEMKVQRLEQLSTDKHAMA